MADVTPDGQEKRGAKAGDVAEYRGGLFGKISVCNMALRRS